MSLKQKLNQFTIAAILAGATSVVSAPVFAQPGFYFPSASFFSPLQPTINLVTRGLTLLCC